MRLLAFYPVRANTHVGEDYEAIDLSLTLCIRMQLNGQKMDPIIEIDPGSRRTAPC